MSMTLDVDAIADGIAAPKKDDVSRRVVTKGAAWSLPVIATGIAAPMAAASPVCGECVGNTGPANCIVEGFPGGNCRCAAGLICVGSGFLGLTNVCVGATLPTGTCAGSPCVGVCLSLGGIVPAAINTLSAALSVLITSFNVLGAQTCVQSYALPANLCASPLNDGKLGSLCSRSSQCGTNLVAAVALATVVTAYNGLISALGSLGLVAVTQCQSPYICKSFVDVGIALNTFLPGDEFGFQLQVGFCQCPDGSRTCRETLPAPCTLKP